MKTTLLMAFLFVTLQTSAQNTTATIVPQPVSLQLQTGTFELDAGTVIRADAEAKHEADMLNLYLKQLYGFTLPVKNNVAKNTGSIYLKKIKSGERKDAYQLQVDSKNIIISSSGNEGLFYGIQTLLQLMPSKKSDVNDKSPQFKIQQLSIKDYPRFNYRGMHLDVSRHFFDVKFIKKYLDYLAFQKFNTFHWHLTDDQGWRIEIKKYPLLTSVGGFRNGTIIGRYPGTGNDNIHYGGFYTQEEIKEVVKYAKDRFITVIPEIEMPGHASAAIAAYPELSCFPDESTKIPKGTVWAGSQKGKQVQQTFGVFEDIFAPTDYTFKFLENVLDEVIALFPSKYIHIGGDEAPKDSWKRSAFAQKLIKEDGLKDEHGLQSYFIQRIEKYLNSKGRNIIGWDEILEGGLAPNATVMSWRGEEGGILAAKDNHNVIMTPGTYCYFDHSQSRGDDSVTIGGYLPLDKVYSYEPIPKEINAEQAKFISGAQANVWTEYIGNPSKVEYMIFPRMSALSEVLWSPKESKNWDRFSSELSDIYQRYSLWGTNYSTAYFDLQSSVIPSENNQGVQLKLDSKFSNSVTQYKTETDKDWKIYSSPIPITATAKVEAFLKVNGKESTIITRNFSFNKATGKKITLTEQPSPSYPGSGAFTLVNGIITTKGLAESSEWLGFAGKDAVATIDMGQPTEINSVVVNTLEQAGSWIYLPKSIEISHSNDGVNFTPFKSITDTGSPTDDGKTRKFTLSGNTTARYLKVTAKNLGKIPEGFPGAGNEAWLFLDEIEVL